MPRTAGSLAASRHLKGVVRVAAGDVARVVGVCDSVVKEIHGGGSCGVSWTLLYWYFQNKISALMPDDLLLLNILQLSSGNVWPFT